MGIPISNMTARKTAGGGSAVLSKHPPHTHLGERAHRVANKVTVALCVPLLTVLWLAQIVLLWIEHPGSV